MPVGPKGEHYAYTPRGKAAHARAMKKAKTKPTKVAKRPKKKSSVKKPKRGY